MHKVLIVVDMQNDFITGSLGTPEARAIFPNVKKKIEEAVQNQDYIIYTRDTHFKDYLESREGKKLPVEHCIANSEGWRIPEALLPHETYDRTRVVNKYTFGSHYLATNLNKILTEMGARLDYDEIELVGLCTDICVVSNALLLKSLYYNDLEISVDATCCAGVTPETHEAALKTMEMCQITIKR